MKECEKEGRWIWILVTVMNVEHNKAVSLLAMANPLTWRCGDVSKRPQVSDHRLDRLKINIAFIPLVQISNNYYICLHLSYQTCTAAGIPSVLPSNELCFASSMIWITDAASSHFTSSGALSRIAAARFRYSEMYVPLSEGRLYRGYSLTVRQTYNSM